MAEPGPVGRTDESSAADDLAVFVDRLAAAGSDRPTALARTQIRRAIGDGHLPPGLRQLAEALAASVDRAPAPRRSAEDAGSVVDAMRTNSLVVLADCDVPGLARTLDELLADGKRVVVTGPDQRPVDQLRQALPEHTAGRVLTRLPPLGPAELRELRGLLATSTAARRARSGQELPDPADLPDPDGVARLCRKNGGSPGPGSGLVPELLGALDPDRRAAVTSIARLVDRSLSALPPAAECEWAWRLLSNLVLAQHRPAFDGLLEDIAQALAAVQRGRGGRPVTFVGRPPDGILGVLRGYRDFLAGGGRSRTYFRSTLQREAEPVLAGIRVDGRVPVGEPELGRVIDYLELGEWLRRVCARCAELGVPAPRDDGELGRLNDVLLRVAAAARSVGALRHDVLFLAPGSPLQVPDVPAAAEIATAVLEFEVTGAAAEAGRRLDELAERLAGRCPAIATAPEHEAAVAALRQRDAAGYAAAVDALSAARRAHADEARCAGLLQRLRAAAPELAAAWAGLTERGPGAPGLAVFQPMEQLLAEIPPPDSADVVLVLGAAALGVQHLLLTAVAPRMIAAVAPGEQDGAAPTLLSVLGRADALVLNTAPAAEVVVPAPVVPISLAAQARPGRPGVLRRAGA